MNNNYNIPGDNVHIFKYIDASPFEIVCATDIVVEYIKELIGATTPDSGNSNEVRPRMRNINCTVSGAITSTNDSNLSIFHFFDETVTDEAQDLEVVFTDNGGSQRTIRGNFYIERITLSSPSGESATYDFSLRGSGGYTASELIDPTVTGTNITSGSYTVSGGKIQDNDWMGLSDTNIIEVCREGSEQLSIGLPFTFNGATGEITPDVATTIDGQRMLVIWTYG